MAWLHTPVILFVKGITGLRCWVCGSSAELYNTDPTDPNRKNFDTGSTSWCSSMVTSATCISKNPGEEMLCYKEGPSGHILRRMFFFTFLHPGPWIL